LLGAFKTFLISSGVGAEDHGLMFSTGSNGIAGAALGETLIVYDENTQEFSRLHDLAILTSPFNFPYSDISSIPVEVDDDWVYIANLRRMQKYTRVEGGSITTYYNPGGNTRAIFRISRDESQGLTFDNMGTVSGTSLDLTNFVCIEKGSSGDVYAGGSFATISSVSNTKRIAKWNATTKSWQALSTGIGSEAISTSTWVTSIAFSADDSIYASYNKGTSSEIYHYGGTSWALIGTANSTTVLLELDEDENLVAAGNFTAIGGLTASRVAVYDTAGLTWSIPDAYDKGFNGAVRGLFLGPTGQDMYFVGNFTTARGVSATYAARRIAGTTAWVDLGVGFGDVPADVSVSEGGNFFAAQTLSVTNTRFRYRDSLGGTGSFLDRDKHAPTRIVGESGLSNRHTLKSRNGKTCMFVPAGDFVFGLGKSDNTAEGYSWKEMDDGEFNISSKLSKSSNPGNFKFDDDSSVKTLYGNFQVGNIFRWNPNTKSWSLFVDTNGPVRDMQRIGSNLFFCGDGNFRNMVNFITRWNGSTFNQMGTGLNGGGNTLASDGTNLFVGGAFTTAGGTTVNRIAKWDGLSWSAMNTGTVGVNNTVIGTVWDSVDSKLYAVGAFTTAGGTAANRVAVWDSATSIWSPLGTGLNNTCYDIVLDPEGRKLYMCGLFTTANGSAANRVVGWDIATSSFFNVGSSTFFSSAVASLDAVRYLHWDSERKRLYLSGGFRLSSSGRFFSGIAYWDGTSWNPVKSESAVSWDNSGGSRHCGRVLSFNLKDVGEYDAL
jgi:hypothetical protein